MAKKASPRSPKQTGELQVVFVTQPGPYAGRQILLESDHAGAALADGWGVETGDAFAPNDTPQNTNTETPQSYLDWVDSLSETDDTPPPEPPVTDPAATLTSLSPSTAQVGSSDVTMSVNGSGFTAGSVIVFNGFDEETVFVSASEVTTVVKPSLFSEAIPLPVQVRNTGGMSNSLDFTFTEAVQATRK